MHDDDMLDLDAASSDAWLTTARVRVLTMCSRRTESVPTDVEESSFWDAIGSIKSILPIMAQ